MLFFLTWSHAACPDLEQAVASAESAVAELRIDDATSLLAEAERALECEWADPLQLARLWNAEGVLAVYEGDEAASGMSFAAARRVAPSMFGAHYGSKMKARWEAAEQPSTTGEVSLDEPLPEGAEARVDGTPQGAPWQLATGLHVVQVGGVAAPSFGRVIEVQQGIPLMLQPQLPIVDASEPAGSGPLPVRRRKSPTLLIGSAAALAVGGAMLGLAFREQQAVIPKSETVPQLKAARSRQLGFGYTGYGLVGLAAVGVVVHFVR